MKELEMADITLVTMKSGYPHCKRHGAMNHIANYRDGSKVWRCVSTYKTNPKDLSKPMEQRNIMNACRAGCITEKG